MKNTIQTTFIAFSALFLSSCGDSHDKLMKDQVAWMNETTEILNQVADGSMSSADASSKIKKLGEDADEFMRRKEVLNKDLTPERMRELVKEHQQETSQAFGEYLKAVEKLSRSGRMTKELGEAISNMSPKSKTETMLEEAAGSTIR